LSITDAPTCPIRTIGTAACAGEVRIGTVTCPGSPELVAPSVTAVSKPLGPAPVGAA